MKRKILLWVFGSWGSVIKEYSCSVQNRFITLAWYVIYGQILSILALFEKQNMCKMEQQECVCSRSSGAYKDQESPLRVLLRLRTKDLSLNDLGYYCLLGWTYKPWQWISVKPNLLMYYPLGLNIMQVWLPHMPCYVTFWRLTDVTF